MERELIFSKKSGLGKREIMQEIELMKKIYPYTDSFESFKASNEVFDISKRKQVTGTLRLWSVFKRGAGKKASYFVIGKN